MRRFLILALALAALLIIGRPAQAFHRHRSYGQPVAPVAADPNAPINFGRVLQLASTGLQVAQGFDNSGITNRLLQILNQQQTQQSAQPVPVPQDVVETLNQVDAALPDVVSKSNKIADLNSKLYVEGTNWHKVSIAAATTGGSSGAPNPKLGQPPGPK